MICLKEASLQRASKILLESADLTLHTGWHVGLTGANGIGKSTLFALFLGKLHLDQGDLDLPAAWQIAHVAQETPASTQSALNYVLDGDQVLRQLQADLLAAQQAEDGLLEAELHSHLEQAGAYTAQSRAAEILHGLGFASTELDQSVKAFSGGWRMRLNLAQALFCRSDLLLLDEPTNHLDLDALIWFEAWLKRYTGTLLMISHDREFLDSTVQHIVHFDQLKLILYKGHYSDFERQRAERLAQQQAAHERQTRVKADMQRFVDRFRAKASKAKQAQSRLKALDKMQDIAAAQIDSPFHFSFAPPEQCPRPLLNLDQLTFGYDNTPIVQKINRSLQPGARIGLLGPNGAGKSTFIKGLAGMLPPLSGAYEASQGLKIAYFAQHQIEQLHADSSCLEHIFRQSPDAKEQAVRSFLGGFNFRGAQADMPIAPFSGGEKARLALALLVWQKPNLLLLDEPTNHLDIHMRQALSSALQNYAGALVLVSHDRHLLMSCVDEFWLVAEGGVETFEGDLDDYRQYLLKPVAKTASKTAGLSQKKRKQQNTEQRAAKRLLENKTKKLEKQLETNNAKKKDIENQLLSPAVYGNHEKARLLMAEQAQIEVILEEIEMAWLEAHEALETIS